MAIEILATIGPASHNRLKDLIDSGMSGIRINSSHGNPDEHLDIINSYRRLTSTGFVVYDIKGPKIRFGDFPEPFPVRSGMTLTLNSGLAESSDREYPAVESFDQGLPITYPLHKYVKKNDRLMVDDGYVCLKVLNVQSGTIECTVEYGDVIRPRKGINHPDTVVPFPYTMPHDVSNIEFAKKHKVDYLADSFTRNRDDVLELRQQLKDTDVRIISKIENPEALDNFAEILAETDAIMIARGDLGIEVDPWRLPELQKEMIAQCNKAGKPVITATQMMESMIDNPFPSRADVSDVANAIYDGTDVVMLSAETSVGTYPVECLTMMRKISDFTTQTERYKKQHKRHVGLKLVR